MIKLESILHRLYTLLSLQAKHFRTKDSVMSGSMQFISTPKTRAQGVLVRGAFGAQARKKKRLRQLSLVVAGGILLLSSVSSLAAYAIRLQVEQDVTRLTQDTRNLDEMNRTLTVTLNREQSFLNIAEKAQKALPYLRATQDVIDVSMDHTLANRLPLRPTRPVEPAPSLPGY
jgi:hypothetical protein